MTTHATTMQQLNDLGQTWAMAELRGDTVVLADLLSDDFLGVGPLGFVLNKEQWLMRHRSGDLILTGFTWDDTQIRSYGDDTAIVIGRQTQTGTHKGHDATAQLRMTQVYVRIGGEWKLASAQMSPITALPAAANAATQKTQH